MTNVLRPTRAALHGQFRRDLEPALQIESGERVSCQTLDVMWGMGQHPLEGNWRPKFEPRGGERDDGPALCGPVAIRGARPGQMLEIELEEIRPATWGWTFAGDNGFNGPLIRALGLADEPSTLLRWELDPDALIGVSELGQRVELQPFLGIIGMPADVDGWQTGWFPRRTGGNMDCRALVRGTKLFLPIEVDGALVSLGDGHARQGDGEVAASAIECMMERVTLRYTLRDDIAESMPHAWTPQGWVTLGFDRDLDRAVEQALDGILRLIARELDVSRGVALALASAVVDLRITQLVNGVRGVHAVWPHGSLG
ncbi:MAG: acetamidase/formamidase family protein [Myxococcales bacterium]|nr:acetamidase/formamidase family protein [Myxococcales bacterium]